MSERQQLINDIHYVGYYSPEAIADYLLSVGWRLTGLEKTPEVHIHIQQGVDSPTHWANGQPRLLTPEAYERMKGQRS